MSTPLQTRATPRQPPDAAAELSALRAELDGIDDDLHTLLRRRAEVVARVGRSASKGAVKLRLGRQAAILRRLVARHTGPYPHAALVRVWLELLAGSTAMQGPFAIAVCQGDDGDRGGGSVESRGNAGDPSYAACAREQFGGLTRMRLHHTPAQALAEVSAGIVTAAVLPLPTETEPAAAAWWIPLLQARSGGVPHRPGPGSNGTGPEPAADGALRGERSGALVAPALPGGDAGDPRLHVIARLPLWAPRPEGAPGVEALVVAAVPPDPSGLDRTLLGLEVLPDTDHAQLQDELAAAGLPVHRLLLRRNPHTTCALAEIEGFVTASDPRLSAMPDLVVLGAYAVPLGAPS